MSAKIGFVTIGQSPRTDVVPEIVQILIKNGLSVTVLEKGALDTVSGADSDVVSPVSDEDVLVTRLRNGQEVMVSRQWVIPKVQQAIDQLVQESVNVIALLCAGDFSDIRCDVPLIRPDRLLYGVLGSLSIKKIGVLIPSSRQSGFIREKFASLGYNAVVVSASPYRDPHLVKEAAKSLVREKVDAVVLDCFGYTLSMKEEVQAITRKPVLLVRSLLAYTIAELLR